MRFPIILLVFLIIASCQSQHASISEFRGPDRTGIYIEDNLLDSWPEKGPEEVFFIDSIGKGYGSPVISDNLMYFTGAIDSTSILFCFDLNGQKVWEINLGIEWVKNFPGSRSSPTIVDNLIYVGTGMGSLLCINKTDQTVKWSIDFDDYKGVLPLFGHSESPVIHENMVFWTIGGKKNNIIALDRLSGELIWSAKGKEERPSYSSPNVITTPAGKNILINFSAYHMMGFNVETGELLWAHEQDNYSLIKRKPGYGDTHANTIVYDDGAIYYAAGDGNCGVKLNLSDDDSILTEVWRNKRFDNYMGGIVKLGDHLYASGARKPKFYSIEAETGILCDSLAIGKGVVVYADDMIYFYSQRGEVHLVSIDQGIMKDISSFRITKGSQEHFSHPIFHKGVMYLRHGHVIMGYNLNEE